MDIKYKVFINRLLVRMNQNPDYSKKIGLEDQSGWNKESKSRNAEKVKGDKK